MGYRKIMHKPFIGIVMPPNKGTLTPKMLWEFVMDEVKASHRTMHKPFIGIVRLPRKEMQWLN